MFEKIGDNLNILMARSRINASELARLTGLPASTIKKIRNNDSCNPTLATLHTLSRYFSVSISQFIGEENFPEQPVRREYPGDKQMIQVPLLSWEKVVNWPNDNIQSLSHLHMENKYGKNTYALVVEENEWEGFPKNSILVIDPEVAISHRDFVIVYKQGQRAATLKQILYDEDQSYLKPLTPGYNIAMLTPGHKFLGVVMEYRGQIKTSS